MTGPEHYSVAEKLLEEAADYEGEPTTGLIHLGQLAQAHAILALVAATVEQDGVRWAVCERAPLGGAS